MAARSLGVLTLDLLMRTAGFISGATAAERATDKVTKKIRSSFGGLKGAIAGAFGGFTLAALVGGIVRNTIEAEDALRQLEARLKSTGGVAGVTSEQLQAMAQELQGLTAFGDDAIIAMQGVLLTFTNIRGGTVRQATEAILNLATAMGTDLQSAAVLVGKALNDPVKGATALSKAGVQLSASQKQLIKDFVAVGDGASAQQIILKELETQFGGAAAAAADTFAGSIKQLGNAFGDLLEAKGGLGDAKESVQELTDLLRDPSTVAAAETLTSALFTGFAAVTGAVAGTVNVVKFLGEELARRIGGTALDDIAGLETELANLEELRRTGLADSDFLNRLRFFGKDGAVEWYSNEDLDKAIEAVKAKIKDSADYAPPPVIPLPGGGAAGSGTGVRPPPSGKTTELEFVQVSVRRTRELEEFYEDLQKLTRTSEEEALLSYKKQKDALDFLWKKGGLENVEQYNARLAQINDELLQEVEVTAKRIEPVWEKHTKELSEFQKQAARNTQDIIADTLTGGFDKGAKGVLDSFGDMLTQLAAQAIAADIAGYLFGEEGGGEKGSTGLFDTFLSAAGSYFSAGKAGGGPVSPGNVYPVGERGPELFKPRVPGTIIPNNQLARIGGGGAVVNQTINVAGTPSLRTARQMQIEAARAQRASTSRLG
jgi:hypothetical protein